MLRFGSSKLCCKALALVLHIIKRGSIGRAKRCCQRLQRLDLRRVRSCFCCGCVTDGFAPGIMLLSQTLRCRRQLGSPLALLVVLDPCVPSTAKPLGT